MPVIAAVNGAAFGGGNEFGRVLRCRHRLRIPRLVKFYQQGRRLLDELLAERITLDQVNDGYDKMRFGDQARSVIIFAPPA